MKHNSGVDLPAEKNIKRKKEKQIIPKKYISLSSLASYFKALTTRADAPKKKRKRIGN